MSISDTKAAQKYASIAEVAAAQAKEVLTEALLAPEYADQAAASAAEAASAAQQAQDAADNAATNATDVINQQLAQQAVEFQTLEGEFQEKLTEIDGIITNLDGDAPIKDTVAQGIADTTNGQYFRVSEDGGFTYYKNESGTAQEIATLIGTGSVTSTVREFMSLSEANNDLGKGLIPESMAVWVRSDNVEDLAVEYINVSGALSPTGRLSPTKEYIDESIGEYINLLPLAKTSEFIEVGEPDTQYESVTDSYILTDKNKNIIRCIRDGKMMYFVPLEAAEIIAGKLTVSGVEVDPNGIPPAILSQNLLGLAKSSSFIDPAEFEEGGQYEAVTDKNIVLDENKNFLESYRGGVKTFFTPVLASELSTEKFEIKDALSFMDPELFSPGGEMEGWSEFSDIKTDKDKNILSYLKGGSRHYLLPLIAPSLSVDSLNVDGKGIKDYLGIKDHNIIPYSQEVSGKSQVFTFNNNTSAITQITDGSYNETDPLINDAGLLTWTSDRDSTVIAGKFYLGEDGEIYPLISRTIISGWGDSFMQQPVMMNTLRSLTGLTCYNFGVSGLRSTAVAARQGGEPFYCMPAGGVIPASGEINLIPNVPGLAASASNGAMTGIKVNLSGVDGTFNWSGTQASFIRDTAGEAVNVSELTPIFSYPYTTASVVGSIPVGTLYDQHDEAILVLTCGRNNTTLWTEVLRNITNMVAYLKAYGKRFVICPQFTQSTEIRGTEGYQRVHRINDALKLAFPENYVEINGIDLMQNFKNHYNPAYAQDVTDIANDTTPTSLRTDALHPSQVLRPSALYIGAEVNGKYIYQFMKLKGWVN